MGVGVGVGVGPGVGAVTTAKSSSPRTSPASVISQADFKVDRKSGDIIRSTVTVDNHVVTRDITPDPATAAFVQDWRDRVAAVANQQVGTITADLNRAQTAVGESVLGNVIADAQLEATRTGGGAQVALMNPGGIRADLAFAPDGVVTYGEAFAVQPFSNLMQVVTLTGAQLDALLEQQWTAARTAVLSPSSTLRYTATLSAPFGDRVSDITIDGVPLDPAASYRVAANNFLVGGGDGFSEFLNGTDLWSGPIDLDAFTAYLTAHSPISPPARDRITAG
ncbi:bifunctional metallophosphatase/5'-nucleotidase [Nocardioides sp. J54]|uniref:bifunctional metallophosphatase/5'-nucleotidase n=1 Tax=Nocardioides sp. J54 TaxID=935866 RepID=UPI0018DBE242|nr:5'-nucleotidase C-terminal domain-containing protein [Nocardioides sp. J54]